MFYAISPRHFNIVLVPLLLSCVVYLAIVAAPLSAAAQDPTAQGEPLQEYDLNYPEDGTAPDRRYQMKPYEQYHEPTANPAADARRAQMLDRLTKIGSELHSAKKLEKIGWPLFAILTPLAGACLGVGVYYDMFGTQGFAESVGSVLALGIGGLIIGSIGSARANRLKREQKKILSEINPDGARSSGGDSFDVGDTAW